jgi:Phage derived protein Gp49-like (DUF891)
MTSAIRSAELIAAGSQVQEQVQYSSRTRGHTGTEPPPGLWDRIAAASGQSPAPPPTADVVPPAGPAERYGSGGRGGVDRGGRQRRRPPTWVLLADGGVHLGEPFTRQLRGKLRELRFYLGRSQTRITYYIASGRRIVLLTVFAKQRQRERREIDRTWRAMQRCITEGHVAEEDE